MPDRLTIEFPSMEELKALRDDLTALEGRVSAQMDGLRSMMLQLMDALKEIKKGG